MRTPGYLRDSTSQNNSLKSNKLISYADGESPQNVEYSRDFIEIENLGSGSFANVVKVEFILDHKMYAIKKTK
jgi:hypothetical protein